MKEHLIKLFETNSEVTNTENPQKRELTDEEKHSCRYFLQYKFIPDLAASVSKGELPPEATLRTEGWEAFMKKHVGKDFFFEWEELHCEGFQIDDTHVVALYIFPEPRQVPDAAFGAVLIDTTTNHATYYTLECSYNGNWVLGSMNQAEHRNYGNLENPDLEHFVAWVMERAKDEEPDMSVDRPKEDSEI